MPRPSRLTLFLAGDLMCGRGIDQLLPYASKPDLYEPYVRDARQYITLAEQKSGPIPRPAAINYVWGNALETLAREKPDFRIVNLETAVTTSDDYWPGKGIHYRMHPRNAISLSGLGLDCCALANNHLLDWGYAGLEETLQVLNQLGIAGCGAGLSSEQARAPAVWPIHKGRRILVFSFGLPSSGIPPEWMAGREKPGVNLVADFSEKSLDAVRAQIHRWARAEDTLVASIHWGPNWGYRIEEAQRHFARGLVDAGVDLVHGHSSHHPIGMELYRGRLICYGCGDFVNDYEGIGGYEAFRSHLSLMYFVTLHPSGELAHLRIAPMQMKALRLQHAPETDGAWIARILDRESGRYGLRLRLVGGGTEAPAWVEARPSGE